MIEQVDWSLLTEHFVPQAVLSKSVDFFEKEKGISFVSACDNLGDYKAALLFMDSAKGVAIVLKQYRGGTPNSTVIYLDPSLDDVGKITKLVADIVESLGFESADILWQRRDNPEA